MVQMIFAAQFGVQSTNCTRVNSCVHWYAEQSSDSAVLFYCVCCIVDVEQ